MGLIPPAIGAMVFTVVQFIIFLFVVVATPISMFDSGFRSCFTLWGFKPDCHKTHYVARGISAFGCGQRRNNMNGGAAFAIVSIVMTLITLIFGILIIVNVKCVRMIPLVLCVLSCITILISWACVAGVYSISMCNGSGSFLPGAFKRYIVYGAGFGLMVTAWVLQVLNTIWFIIVSFG